MRFRKLSLALVSISAALLLASCVDTDAKITIDKKGSGRITLDYTVAKAFLEIGELEANSSQLPFPVSREDFSRGIAATKGLRLIAHSIKDRKDTAHISATIGFENPASLAAFLDPRGARAVWSEAKGTKSLVLTLTQGNSALDPDIAALLAEAAGNSVFRLSFDLPSDPENSSCSGEIGMVATKGKNTVYTASLADLAKASSPVVWEIAWK